MPAADLHDRLRVLADFAERAGAPRELLDAVLPPLLELLLDDVGRRRLDALASRREQADLVDRLRGEGATLKAACRQAGISPRTDQRRRRGGDNVASPISHALYSWRR